MTPGAARVVVLSHRMWRREFGSDPAIAGKSMTLRGLRTRSRAWRRNRSPASFRC